VSGHVISIVVGPDHSLWYLDNGSDYRQIPPYANVQKISLLGDSSHLGRPTTTEYPLYDVQSHLRGITAAGDSVWFTEHNTNSIGRINVACADHEDLLNSLPGKRLGNLNNQGCNNPDNS